MSTQKLPPVDETRIEKIFLDLGAMEVHLDPDPLEFGPNRLQHKTAEARGLLTMCERIFLQISRDLQLYKRKHRAAELDFELQMQDLLANDPEVRAGRNVRDRDALATIQLRTERLSLIDMEIAIQDLEAVMKVVKAKRADLRDIQGRIRDQRALCDQEIGLGSQWGSKLPPGIIGPDLDNAPRTDKTALEQVQGLLVTDGDEIHLKAGDEVSVEEVSVEEVSVEEVSVEEVGEVVYVDEAGAEVTTIEPEGEDLELDDLLGSEVEPEVEPKVEGEDLELDDLLGFNAGEVEPSDIDAILATVEAASNNKDPVSPEDKIQITDLPKVGYCSVCLETAHQTPGGTSCVNGHGGASVLDEIPVEPELEPEEVAEVEAEQVEKDVAKATKSSESKAEEPTADEIVVDDLFNTEPTDTTESTESTKSMPSVTTDEDVDDMFRRLTVDPAPKVKAKKGELPPADSVDDMDALIDLFT